MMRMTPTLHLVTTHGRQALVTDGTERVLDVLHRHGIPWSAVSIYLIKADGEPKLLPCLESKLSDFGEGEQLLLYLNRNINPFIFATTEFDTIDPSPGHSGGTEYFYQRLSNADASARLFLKKLSAEECKQIVCDRVRDVIVRVLPRGADLVIGVSGGGDSNALLHALVQLTDHDVRLHPVIIKGIPDWDQGVPRAQALCTSLGLDLMILEEAQVKALLRFPTTAPSLVDCFERQFRGDDFEFVGTLLVRLALSAHARALRTPYICTGLNLEDVLCEGLFRISCGLTPAPIPERIIGDVRLVFPLWLCPKRIIDGCFPRMSLDNYQARYPCVSLGRNLYYSVAYALQSQFPGYVEQLAHGFSELGLKQAAHYVFDEDLGFHIERFVPLHLRRKFRRMIDGSFGA